MAPSIFADVPGFGSMGMGEPPAGPLAAEGTGRSAEDVDNLLLDPFAHEEAAQAVRLEAWGRRQTGCAQRVRWASVWL